MRIQHNIMAMGAYRYYNGKRELLSKNLEKLSSGYRINRAGDDAAGLAISEKMRAQITGLSAAQKNVKDGINLVQTAEGAMQEIHDMLNRMDALATQSANGTYQDKVDRESLQEEVTALKEEIDRIASSANFNGISLMDGSLGTSGTSGTSGKPGASGTPGVSGPGSSGTTRPPGSPEVPAKKTTYEITLKDINNCEDDTKIEVTLDGTHKQTFTIKDDFGAGKTTVTAADVAAKILSEYTTNQKMTIGGQEFTVANSNGTLTLEQNAEPADASEVVPASALKAEVKVTRNTASVTGTAKSDIAFGAKATVNKTSGPVSIVDSSGTVKGTIDISNFHEKAVVDYMRANGIQGNTNNNQRNDFCLWYDTGAGAFKLYLKVGIFGADAIGTPITKTFPAAGETITLNFAEPGFGSITIKNNGTLSTSDFDTTSYKSISVVEMAPAKNGGYIDFGGLDKTKLAQAAKKAGATGDKISMAWNAANSRLELTSNGATVGYVDNTNGISSATNVKCYATDGSEIGTVNIKPGTGATLDDDSFMDYAQGTGKNPEPFDSGLTYRLESKTENVSPMVKAEQGNAYQPAVPPGPTDPDPDNPDPPGPDTPDTPDEPGGSTTGGKGLILQIGDSSETYDRLEVIIDDMHTNAMGTRDESGKLTASIYDIDVGTQKGAQEAIGVIKDAINYVSFGRGRLGSYQNRLDHTENNLSAMSENIQSAESNIRDTDIAEEMMGYVKNNILMQSAQSMLAHANIAPQGVLQLLG